MISTCHIIHFYSLLQVQKKLVILPCWIHWMVQIQQRGRDSEQPIRTYESLAYHVDRLRNLKSDGEGGCLCDQLAPCKSDYYNVTQRSY